MTRVSYSYLSYHADRPCVPHTLPHTSPIPHSCTSYLSHIFPCPSHASHTCLTPPSHQDSLGRLRDISKVEASKREAGEGWKNRPDAAQQDAFLRSQQHTTRGFMRMATSSINWLNVLAQHPQVGRVDAARGRGNFVCELGARFLAALCFVCLPVVSVLR